MSLTINSKKTIRCISFLKRLLSLDVVVKIIYKVRDKYLALNKNTVKHYQGGYV